ncbi:MULTISPECIES: ankyrin repeat domain-containing protein [Wolbachia]|uniref:ankyrin repeat domain-containing protein n=1 Tax=Wolbachia TaxID=953 RepID=UPI001BDC089B|nr:MULTISPECIES: ankyrin repeat domain-containing protein [Wolbachia]BDG75645.1 hypothetical protein wHmt_02030 [Wolbachia pipientis]BDG76970.1 hypothetical protein wHmc_01020 [Wolbachia pipientis]
MAIEELLFWFRKSVLNDHNLDLKDLLQKRCEHAYQEWKEKEFDINHLFSLEEREYRYQSTLLHLVVGDFCLLEEKKKLIQYLLDEGANVNARDSCGNTPLHNSHEKEVTQILLDAGANVNARNLCNNTPLHESLYKEVTQILLDAGANPFIKNDYGMTARDFAYDKEREQLLKKAEDKYKYKAMKVGSVCGVVAALAVGGGLFAAGVALPILVLVGIVVAAAVLTGLIAGGITYAVSTKIENPDTSRSATEQGLPQPN